MKVHLFRKLFYLAMTLSLTACGAVEGVGKGLSGAFKGFGKLIP
jgi:predicted small secreted protein